MVNEILRDRDNAGFGDRNEYGSRMGGGGGIDVSNACVKNINCLAEVEFSSCYIYLCFLCYR